MLHRLAQMWHDALAGGGVVRLLRIPVRWERVARLGAWHDTMSEEARRSLDLLDFWERHGLAAAADHGGVSIRTLYRWQAAYRQSRTEGLVPGSRRPHRTPKREWPAAVRAEIRRLRYAHPNLDRARTPADRGGAKRVSSGVAGPRR